jgi:peptide/nickel transport system substrate-binding protein
MRRALLAALLTAASITAASAADKTLVISIQADPTGFDPEAVLNNTSGFVMATVYDSLVRYKPGTVEVEPGLAESWDIADDGLTYTFHLRPGVSFQDGTPFNAKTYVQGLDRLFK